MNAIRSTPEQGADGPGPELCTLNRVRAGTTVVIRQLTGSPEVNQRLRELGFAEANRIKLISLQHTLLCQVCNARLGLNSRLAECIWVEPVGPRAPG